MITRPLAALGSAVALLGAPSAWAAPGDSEALRGHELAVAGNCDEAIPLLEKAHALRPRPSPAMDLGACLEKKGETVRARDLYAEVASWKRSFQWDYYDVTAWRSSKPKRDALDAQLRAVEPAPVPTPVPAPVPKPVPRVVPTPSPEPKPEPEKPQPEKPEPTGPEEPNNWLGARFQGILIPELVFGFFGDGGTTVFVPGGGLTFTYLTSSPELVFALTYASYGLGDTPFKPNGTPDTEYEIISSDLMSLAATVDVMWRFPLEDTGLLALRVGVSGGIGYTFVGDLRRTQAYPPDGKVGDPDTYQPCVGPNEPAGTFRYCNALDKDADHYDGYAEPSWFSGGARPLIYPWLSVPVGLQIRPVPALSIDIELGVSLSGFVTSVGFRYGL